MSLGEALKRDERGGIVMATSYMKVSVLVVDVRAAVIDYFDIMASQRASML